MKFYFLFIIIKQTMNSANMTDNVHYNCEKRRKYAWGKYFEVQREHHSNQIVIYKQFKNTIRPFPQNILNELKEHYTSLRKTIECPVCLNVIEVDNLSVTVCGHKYCKTCVSKLDKCAICRQPFNE